MTTVTSPGRLVEALLQAQPQLLEAVEDALRAGGVAVVVPRGEAERSVSTQAMGSGYSASRWRAGTARHP